MRNVLLGLALFATPAAAQGWRVNTLPVADVVIRAAADTAHGEPSWCLGVDVDTTSRTVTIWQAVPAEVRLATRGRTTFSCPAGSAVAHGHFLSAGHIDGPSPQDTQDAKHTKAVSILVVIDRLKQIRYAVYAIPGLDLGSTP